jgi:NAD(P)-dependent dehydrogenase (short-subunit alcohol dehydrogenase family)
VYSAFKSAITGFTKSLALELGRPASASTPSRPRRRRPSRSSRRCHPAAIPRAHSALDPARPLRLPSDVAGCAVVSRDRTSRPGSRHDACTSTVARWRGRLLPHTAGSMDQRAGRLGQRQIAF